MGRDHRVRLSPAAPSILKAFPSVGPIGTDALRGEARSATKDVSISVPETCQHRRRERVKALNSRV
jgi:hypothetical protein